MVASNIAYSVFVGAGALVSLRIKALDDRRLGYKRHENYRFVAVGCLLGAVVGAKLGMLLYSPWSEVMQLGRNLASFQFDGKTILGALTGGYVFGEITKRIAGVKFSTGDALAVALPAGQSIGRIGCFFGGCCYGTPAVVPWAVMQAGTLRHPVQLYESALTACLAASLFFVRDRPRTPGHLFRYYLIGYAIIRIGIELFRGEPQRMWGPVSYAQIFSAVGALAVTLSIFVANRRRKSGPNWSRSGLPVDGMSSMPNGPS